MRARALSGIFMFAALLCAAPAPAQKIELFGGYSFVRAPVRFDELGPGLSPVISTTPTLNLSGWEASGAVKVLVRWRSPRTLAAPGDHFKGPAHI